MPPAEPPQDLPLALRLLREELAAIARELAAIEHLNDQGERNARQGDLLRALDRYLRLETESLFPVLDRCRIEHREGAATHARLRAATQRALQQDCSRPAMQALRSALAEHHTQQEEQTWPTAARALGEEAEPLALELEERRQRLRGAYGV
jgi:hypothetical protein